MIVDKSIYDFEKLRVFLDSRVEEIHRETMDNKVFIDSGVKSIDRYIEDGQSILDIGCGHGYAIDKFKELGTNPVGITLHSDDYERNIKKGNDVRYMDMAFLEFEDNVFDIVWARQCLEHSIMPYFVLHEINRVTKFNGIVYIEVPAPDTCGLNEEDPNHYSVFGGRMWAVLIRKSGFKTIESCEIQFQNHDRTLGSGYGVDKFFRFIARKTI